MKKTLFSIFFAASLTFLPSCSNMVQDPETPQDAMMSYATGSSFVDEIGSIGERPNRDTPKKDTTERKRDTVDRRKDTSSSGKRDTVKAPPSVFGDLLVKLLLTSEQKPIVERLLAEHRSCTSSCVKALKESEMQILIAARQKEREIKSALESGKITKTQAKERLSLLKKWVNDQLKNNPVRSKVKECMKSCDAAFINQLERILTPQQKQILASWLDAKNKRGASGRKDSTSTGTRG